MYLKLSIIPEKFEICCYIFVHRRKNLLSLKKYMIMTNVLEKIAPYNLWNGNVISKIYERAGEQSKL